MKLTKAITILTVVLAFVATAAADWNKGDPHKMHYPQLPDLDNGLNVNVMSPLVLADDFECRETGFITDVHIWGSWLGDILPQRPVLPGGGIPDAEYIKFHLSIHEDIPDDGINHSRPGEELWSLDFSTPPTIAGDPYFKAHLWQGSQEDFYDPSNSATPIIGTDNSIWQYNFYIPESLAFEQKEGTIYWLDVSAFSAEVDPVAMFGWKTTDNGWNDDSVWRASDTAPWNELRRPLAGGELGESLDQAFVITPEPATMSLLCIGGMVLLRSRRRMRSAAPA